MSNTNRITSRDRASVSFGSLGLLTCLVCLAAGPVAAAPAETGSQATSEVTSEAPSESGTAKPEGSDAAAQGSAEARATTVKPRAAARANTDPLGGAGRRALRASSSTSRASLEGERVAMRAAAPAASDAAPPTRGKSKKKSVKGDDAREGGEGASDPSDRKISLDEDFLVEGMLEKPNAFFILRRSQSAYDWARLDAKFLPLVLESVQDPLF